MKLGEQPRKVLLLTNQMVQELERVERPVDPKDIDKGILSGLTPQDDTEVRTLESRSDWPSREWIERAVMNQYDRQQTEESTAGSKEMFTIQSKGTKPASPSRI